MAPGAVLDVRPLGVPWFTDDPFLFCVHHVDSYPAGNERFGPAASLAGRDLGQDFGGTGEGAWRMYHGTVVPGFPQHPHRGFETVTVVRRGLVDHSDSLGATARYGDGDVQWLTAGRGIVHAEMFPLLRADAPNPLELFQIWLNLPRDNKLIEPNFTMLWAGSIPERLLLDDAGRASRLRLIAGRFDDVVPPPPPPGSWASRADADVAIWTIAMAPSARLDLPPARAGTGRALYVFAGPGVRVDGRPIERGSMARLQADAAVAIEAGAGESELLLLGGRPIGEPVASYGPFVMNTDAEIRQAFVDYRRTQFGGWPFPSDDPVHGRTGRFARYADGRVETAP